MLRISREDFKRVIDHCITGFPNEACGILAGNSGRVKKVYCMTNAKPGPTYYEMDPAEQFSVMKDMREAGLDMLGIFHSHPTSPAYPSKVDIEKAYWPGTLYPNYPGAVYVIVSLMDMSSPAAKGYFITQGAVKEVHIEVE